MIYGYARVSDPTKDPDGQVADLTAAGCEKIFAESVSGAAGRRRPQFQKLLSILKPGDVFVVTRMSRFARSARDALNTLHLISAKGAQFRSLREAWADSTNPAGRLMMTIAAGFAEFDRESILERTAEGRAHAKARGVKMGPPFRLTAAQAAFVRGARSATPPTHTIGELQRLFNVSRSTICRAARGAPGGGPRQVDLEDFIARARPPTS